MMRIIIEGMDCCISKVVKEGTFVPTYEVNGALMNKDNEDDWSKYEKENVHRSLKAKMIIIVVLGLDDFVCVSHCNTIKGMWDTLQVTHEGVKSSFSNYRF